MPEFIASELLIVCIADVLVSTYCFMVNTAPDDMGLVLFSVGVVSRVSCTTLSVTGNDVPLTYTYSMMFYSAPYSIPSSFVLY